MKREIVGYQARSYKTSSKNSQQGIRKQDFIDDLKFNEDASKQVHKFEQKQRIRDIKDQIDYYGYEIEPFHMKNERGSGTIDQTGYFVFDKERDNKINDAWLDSLELGNQFDKLHAKREISSNKIAEINRMVDGFEKEKKIKFGNIEIGNDFFHSKRFTSREQAQAHYREQDEKDQQDQQVIEEQDEENQEEIPETKIPVLRKKQTQQNDNDDLNLELFEPEQLKQILLDLLEDNESPNQAMKRLKNIFSPPAKVHQFKRNNRKQVKIQEEPTSLPSDLQKEAQQTFNMILELCHTILSKTNDPTIYENKKEAPHTDHLEDEQVIVGKIFDENNEDNIF